MDRIASEVIRALRGRRSQLAFSRRLKYRSNVVADWEQGRRFPTAAEFLRAAQVVGVDLPGAFLRFHAASAAALGGGDDAGVARWLDELRGQSTVQDLAARSGFSRHALGRWLSGRTRPRLPDFLHLVDVLTGRVQDLIAELVDVREIPALAKRVERAAASRTVGLEEPWALPVMLAIETRGYMALERHDSAWLARYLGLPEPRVRACVARLEEAGVIRAHKGRYVAGAPLTIDTRAHPEAGRSLKRHWLMVGMDRVGQPKEGDILAYNLFAVSRADLDHIRSLQRSFFREVRGIVAASEPSESVALLNLQLVTWEE